MNDTTFFKRVKISGTLKACFLYVFADSAAEIGEELQRINWSEMDLSKIIGWALVKAAGIALMIKAFYSNSSPVPTMPKPSA